MCTPEIKETGQTIQTPRGTFYVTTMTKEEMRQAGYSLHHSSNDGQYLIMTNGHRAYAVKR